MSSKNQGVRTISSDGVLPAFWTGTRCSGCHASRANASVTYSVALSIQVAGRVVEQEQAGRVYPHVVIRCKICGFAWIEQTAGDVNSL